MAHAWRFFRAGGVDQVQLSRGADLAHLGELDQKLWVALACPVSGLAIDARTLKLIDTDGDGRIRANELIAAARWMTSALRDPESLTQGSSGLAVSNIDDRTPEGKELLAATKALLSAVGKADATTLQVEDVAGAALAFGKQPFNGDGIVTPASAGNADEKLALQEAVTHTSALPDRSGEPGVSAATLGTFFGELDAYLAWLDAGTASELAPLGSQTADGYAALWLVRSKIDDYFGRTRIAGYDPRALQALNRAESEYVPVGAGNIRVMAEEIEHFPLAHIEAQKPLPLRAGLNPAWATRVQALVSKVVEPLLGSRESLTPEAWTDLLGRFSAYEAWLAKKPASRVTVLSEARVRALSEPTLRARLLALVAQDEAESVKASLLDKVERLAYLHRDLFKLAHNFVSFRAFYARTGQAAFQDGSLFIDQRECELVLRVEDAGKHAVLASLSRCFLMYCDIRNARGEKRQIVAAMTNGAADNITVGRNGVFYDREGNDWDATVTKVVDSPISVRAAFWAPYKKAMRSVEEFVTKRAAAAEAESDKKLGEAVASAQSATEGVPKAVKPTKLDIGVVAALGVAVGGITAALGALMQSFFGLGIWMPLGVLGVILVISGPSMAIAWLKLRQRNLAPLLDANGWAINSHAKLNVRFGEALTKVATLPKGAARDLSDPFAEKRRPVGFYVFMLALFAFAFSWYIGKLDGYLPPVARSIEVLGDAAPARVQMVPAVPAVIPVVPPTP
jgi:hypothetical protein